MLGIIKPNSLILDFWVRWANFEKYIQYICKYIHTYSDIVIQYDKQNNKCLETSNSVSLFHPIHSNRSRMTRTCYHFGMPSRLLSLNVALSLMSPKMTWDRDSRFVTPGPCHTPTFQYLPFEQVTSARTRICQIKVHNNARLYYGHSPAALFRLARDDCDRDMVMYGCLWCSLDLTISM